MLTGEYPFTGSNQPEIFEKISRAGIEMNMEPLKFLSENAIDLIKKMLIKNPQFRISAKEALEHPWFSQLLTQDIRRSPDILRSLKEYKSPTKLYKTAMKVIVKFLRTSADLKELRDAFTQIDTEQSGYITISDLEKAVKSDGISISKRQIDKIFNCLSENQDGKIQYSDFLAATISNKLELDDTIISWVFKMFEFNNLGIINAQSLQTVFERLGKSITPEKLYGVIREASNSKGDSLNFEQFKKILQSKM